MKPEQLPDNSITPKQKDRMLRMAHIITLIRNIEHNVAQYGSYKVGMVDEDGKNLGKLFNVDENTLAIWGNMAHSIYTSEFEGNPKLERIAEETIDQVHFMTADHDIMSPEQAKTLFERKDE